MQCVGRLTAILIIIVSKVNSSSQEEPKCGEFYWPTLIPNADRRDQRLLMVDGQPAHNGQFPHSVEVVYEFHTSAAPDRRQYAASSGVIIGQSHVLTTYVADPLDPCKTEPSLGITTARTGGYIRNVGSITRYKGLKYRVESFTVHPNFSCNLVTLPGGIFFNATNDIVLIKIVGKFKFKVNERGGVNRVCMPERNVSYGDSEQSAYFSGSGANSYQNWSAQWIGPKNLHYMNTSFVDLDECSRQMKRRGYVIDPPQDTVCTGAVRATDDRPLCSGDAGGALVRFVDFRWELVGVHSRPLYGKYCVTKQQAYTRVVNHLDWLRSQVPDLRYLSDK